MDSLEQFIVMGATLFVAWMVLVGMLFMSVSTVMGVRWVWRRFRAQS